jgi:UDP-N-acetylglucosamine 2-epimerase
VKVLSVVGARPQFIKAAPVGKALRAAGHTEILVHTGQHYDDNMSKVFFEELELPQPDIYLDVGSGSHAQQTARIMLAFEPVLEERRSRGAGEYRCKGAREPGSIGSLTRWHVCTAK